MAVLVDAQLYGGYSPPAVTVAVTGVAGADRVNVYREAPGSPRRLVRGGYDVIPTSDALVVYDLEAELDRPLVYVAEVWAAGAELPTQTSTGSTLTVPAPDRHVLSDAFTGEPVLVDLVATADEREQETAGSLLRIAGRRAPVALYDVRSGDAGELALYTRDRAETLALEKLLATGAPIVSRHRADGCDVAGSEVLYFPTHRRARRSRAGDRTWRLPFVVVDTPDPRLSPVLLDLDDLAAFFTGRTLADIAAAYPTLLDLARDDYGTAS